MDSEGETGMNTLEFQKAWPGKPLIRFRYPAEALPFPVRVALREVGLPSAAEPWLTFMEIRRVDKTTAAMLTEKQAYPIGLLPNGAVIGILPDGRILILERDAPDDEWLLNTSLAALYESLFLYTDFLAALHERCPNYASDLKIPDDLLASLTEALRACDSAAFDAHGFWYNAVQALRDDSF